MKRNLKALGLALVAAFALSVVAASAASAEVAAFNATKFPVVLTGHQEGTPVFGETNYFEATDGSQVTCTSATYEGTASKTSTSITVEAEYGGCKANTLGLGVTIHMKSCAYVFHAGTFSGGVAHGTADVECTKEGDEIEVTVGSAPTCVVDVPEQTGLKGVTFKNIEAGETTDHYVTVEVDITNEIEYTDTDVGIFCPFSGNSTGTEGSLVTDVIVKGYEDEGPHNEETEVGIEVETIE